MSHRRLPYQPALDGLRALAVVAVMAYHFEPDALPGGYLGVDAFFVLSGFLITGLLLSERRDAGRIDLGAFWGRRARRLLPALLLLLTAVAVVGSRLWAAERIDQLRDDSLAGLLYAANWRVVLTGQSYFDVVSAPSPLRHLWSLAIEEQFYLVWPLLVAGLLRVRQGSRRVLAGVTVAIVAASAVAMAALFEPLDPSRAYYGTDTRVHSLLVGSLLALALEGRTLGAAARRAVAGAGALGLAGFAWAVASVPDRTAWMYRGGFLAFAVAVAATVAAAVQPGGAVRRLLARRPLVAVGRVSYGLYLWHWPVQVFATRGRTGLDGAALTLTKVAITAGATLLSYFVVEQPIRRGALRGRVATATTPAAMATVAAVIVVATLAVPVPRAITPIIVEPAPAAAAAEPPRYTRVLFVGDSVAWTLEKAMAEAAAARGLELTSIAWLGCGVVRGQALTDGGQRFPWSETCDREVAARQADAVAAFAPDLVVVYSTWETTDREVDGTRLRFGTPAGDAHLRALLDEAVGRLAAAGARVTMIAPPPVVDGDERAADRRLNQALARYRSLLAGLADDRPDVAFVDGAAVVCQGHDPCPEEIGGVRLRPRDGNHFTPETAAAVAGALLDAAIDATATDVALLR